jgi:acyl carrier protein
VLADPVTGKSSRRVPPRRVEDGDPQLHRSLLSSLGRAAEAITALSTASPEKVRRAPVDSGLTWIAPRTRLDEGLSMGNLARLEGAFVEGLSIPKDSDFSSLAYRSIEEWDSVAHMQLVAEIEDTFDVMLETQDVIDMSTFTKAQEILAKYGVTFGTDE